MINIIISSMKFKTKQDESKSKLGFSLVNIGHVLLLSSVLAITGCGGATTDGATGGAGAGAGGGGGAGGGVVDGGTAGVTDLSAFSTTLYPLLLSKNCGSCHGDPLQSGAVFSFASSSQQNSLNVITTAGNLVRLDNSAGSRLVQKMDLNHKCGGVTTCQATSSEFKAAIDAWAASVANSGGGAGAVAGVNIISSSLSFADAAEKAATGRVETDVIAKYEFKAGTGTTVFDTSGVAPALNLTMSGDVNWIAGEGIHIADANNAGVSKAVATQADSKKLYDMIGGAQGTKQYTIEAWIFNDALDLTGPARIVSYGATSTTRNFMMGQVTDYYRFRNQTDKAVLDGSSNGEPELETDNNNKDLKMELQHVVMTFDPAVGRHIYINGQKVAYEGGTDSTPDAVIGDTWNPNYTFILGNEVPDGTIRQWKGKMFYVAIHKSALTAQQVLTNANAGVGTKLSLDFDVSSLLDSSGATTSKITLGVSELDAFSYVFGEPVLTTNLPNPNIPVKNMRIAVNGIVPAAAQAFKNMDMTVTAQTEDLSRLGAVIPKDKGVDADMFTLIFEVLGNNQNVVAEPVYTKIVDTSVNDPSSEAGVRTFEQINNTMSNLTGVSKGVTNATFAEIKQQLPSTPTLGGFVSAQQVGISKLALEYCDALVDNGTLRSNFFGNTFEFGSAVPTAFSNQTKQDIIISNLVNKMVGINLSSQPSLAELQPDLDQLIGELIAGCDATSCPASRTRTVVKAACAAVLASAVVTIQ